MVDFKPISINGTAEQLEKLLGMDIVEFITENSNDGQLPTSGAVFRAIKNLQPDSGGSLSVDIVDNVLVVTLSGSLSANIQNGVLVIA